MLVVLAVRCGAIQVSPTRSDMAVRFEGCCVYIQVVVFNRALKVDHRQVGAL